MEVETDVNTAETNQGNMTREVHLWATHTKQETITIKQDTQLIRGPGSCKHGITNR